MSTTYPTFVYDVVGDDAALLPLLAEHLDDYDGDPAPYLLLYDLQAWALGAVDSDPDAVSGLLVRLATAVEGGDADVVDCVAGAFLEGLPSGSQPGAGVRRLLPPALAERLAAAES